MKTYLDGKITLESDNHTVEYELGSMTGGKTLFLRTINGKHNIPIHFNDIDNVVQSLLKGKKTILALEGDDIEQHEIGRTN